MHDAPGPAEIDLLAHHVGRYLRTGGASWVPPP